MIEHQIEAEPVCYGLVAEFADPEELLHAAQAAYGEGYRIMDAYSPFSIDGLSEALGFRRTMLPLVILLGGILGGLLGYFLQYWISVVDYPVNIGGRPYHSWPAFMPVTYEMVILGASLAAVLGMLALNGLPMPYHPLFNVTEFARASRDRFFLCIECRDPKFEMEQTQKFLENLHPERVFFVEA